MSLRRDDGFYVLYQLTSKCADGSSATALVMGDKFRKEKMDARIILDYVGFTRKGDVKPWREIERDEEHQKKTPRWLPCLFIDGEFEGPIYTDVSKPGKKMRVDFLTSKILTELHTRSHVVDAYVMSTAKNRVHGRKVTLLHDDRGDLVPAPFISLAGATTVQITDLPFTQKTLQEEEEEKKRNEGRT